MDNDQKNVDVTKPLELLFDPVVFSSNICAHNPQIIRQVSRLISPEELKVWKARTNSCRKTKQGKNSA